ncbi:MAG: UDP-N-acetylmuramate dehydrogenase, partial [Oleibacter sp.]|nr:UDP-N-acetylmuramate dehydrogenase [Thalassolituus sp.]
MTDKTLIQQAVDLSLKNTLRLTGICDYFAHFNHLSDVISLSRYAQTHALKLRVLGGGSNILMAPKVGGLVIQAAANQLHLVHRNADHVWLDVDAGYPWHQFVCDSIQYGHGIENLALIPGTVGAAPVQNIGAYGVEVQECIDSVTGFQISTQQLRVFNASECGFGYRDSIFKRELTSDFVILRVRFKLNTVFSPNLQYAPLNQLDASTLTPSALIDAVCQVRQSKLPDPNVTPNAGSFFKNPVVSAQKAAELQQQWPQLPVYPQPNHQAKLAAGWLIEQCGFKGKRIGNVGMHDRQALVLTTAAGA